MVKKICKCVFFLVLVVVLGGVSGIVGDRIVIPWLSSFDSFSKMSFFQKANERVTVINKTEQITVKEDYTVTKAAQNILPSVVSIISYPNVVGQQIETNIKTSSDIDLNVKTGIVLTGDGLVVSVVKGREDVALFADQEYKILISDGRELDAEFVDYDAYSGLVYYKINGSNLPAPSLGDSNSLESGEKVVLIGNAGGEYQNTFTTGLIRERNHTFSLLNSELSVSEKIEGAILTDANINSDNIGGPVVDFNGNIVGIADLIEKNGQEIGFVMPINDVKRSFEKIVQEGKIERPILGAYYLSINREIALLNNLPVSRGALVYSFSGQRGLAVIKGSPADIYGLGVGDIITKVGGKEIDLESSLSDLVSQYKPGEKTELSLLRGGEEIQLDVILQ